jgi:hypothetical protein
LSSFPSGNKENSGVSPYYTYYPKCNEIKTVVISISIEINIAAKCGRINI